MSKSINQTLLSIVALAGNKPAQLHAAFADLTRGVSQFVTHGNKNPLSDTRDALATLPKRGQVTRVADMVATAYAAADIEWSTHKRANPDASGAVERIVAACVAAYDAADEAAEAARKVKVEQSKAAKLAAERALKRAAKAIEPAKAAVTLADAIDMLRAACASGDDSALSALESMAADFLEAHEVSAEPVSA